MTSFKELCDYEGRPNPSITQEPLSVVSKGFLLIVLNQDHFYRNKISNEETKVGAEATL